MSAIESGVTARSRRRMALGGLGAGLVVAGSIAAGAAQAANQGSLGGTSQGSFALAFDAPPAVRNVQVLNLVDVTVNNASGPPSFSWPENFPRGASTTFCVVDTNGGAVSVAISSLGGYGGSPGYLIARASDGATISYRFVMSRLNNTTFGEHTSATLNFVVPANEARRSAAECSSLGDNFRFHFGLATLPADGRIYSDTLTITVTPN